MSAARPLISAINAVTRTRLDAESGKLLWKRKKKRMREP